LEIPYFLEFYEVIINEILKNFPMKLLKISFIVLGLILSGNSIGTKALIPEDPGLAFCLINHLPYLDDYDESWGRWCYCDKDEEDEWHGIEVICSYNPYGGYCQEKECSLTASTCCFYGEYPL
jgi:hypothetical protein